VGLTPGYDVIGIWGAVFLTIGRVLQGLAIGGQWSGSVLMAAEWTDPKRRGFTTSFAQLGAPGGMVLANGALALMTGLTSDQAFLDWGWRVPFLASVALVITGFYIRSGVHETPVFDMRLDAICPRGPAPTAAGVDRDVRGSDHYAVWVDLDL